MARWVEAEKMKETWRWPDLSNDEKEFAKAKVEFTVLKNVKMTRELNEILLNLDYK